MLRLILGIVFVGMGVGQLVSWSSMPEILAAYDLLGETGSGVLAAALIGGELVAGVWFLVRPRSQVLSPVWVYAAVSVAWTVLGGQAYLRGVDVDNCGCFGRYLTQELSWFTLAQDGLLLVYAVLMVRSARRAVDSGSAAGVSSQAFSGGVR